MSCLELKPRSKSGNILVIVVAVICLIALFIMFFPFKLGLITLSSSRHSSAVEAAALAAAKELSRITVNDPHFGYIALSDSPPVGKGTTAGDGEPTPVLGINTVLGGVRLTLILADKLHNKEMLELAKLDLEAARKAGRLLEEALKKSLDPSSNYQAKDMNGDTVKPYDSARAAYFGNQNVMPFLGNTNLKNFKLSLGWIKTGGSTVTLTPVPSALAEVPNSAQQNKQYRAFINIPYLKESFYFAGVGTQVALLDPTQFMPADGKRICSVVRVDADIADAAGNGLHNASCAQPHAVVHTNCGGVMRISFMDGFVQGITSLHDLLSDEQLSNSRMKYSVAAAGDYPLDRGATLVASVTATGDQAPNATQMIAQSFFDWVRTAHAKPNLGSLLAIVNEPFRSLADGQAKGSGDSKFPAFTYEFDRDGNVIVSNHKRNPFISQTVHENQCFAISDQARTAGGASCLVSCRDQVRNSGIAHGGKHAGQLMPGNPINWCELPYFDGSVDAAAQKGYGSKALALTVKGNNRGCAGGKSAVSVSSAQFYSLDDKVLPVQPRKSYYSGGLAVEIQVSPQIRH